MMIETVNIADLHDSEFNPRVKLEKTRKSIKKSQTASGNLDLWSRL